MRLFVGYDPREEMGFHAFMSSLMRHGSEGIEITPLCGDQRDGTNAFTYERFRIPEMMCWAGSAIFLDGSDMLMRAPIGELLKLRDPSKAVQVVKHDYRTRHKRKYVGTEMEADNADYPRKNWSSVIIWNFASKAHFKARNEIREAINRGDGAYLHRFAWLADDDIGELPADWNWLADEYGENPEAKLLHWTAGIPGFEHYRKAPHAAEWHAAFAKVTNETGLQRDVRVLQERLDHAWEVRRVLQWAVAQTSGRVHKILGDVTMGKTFAQALEANPEPNTKVGST